MLSGFPSVSRLCARSSRLRGAELRRAANFRSRQNHSEALAKAMTAARMPGRSCETPNSLLITSHFNNPSIGCLVLSYILATVQMIQFTVHQLAEVEKSMNPSSASCATTPSSTKRHRSSPSRSASPGPERARSSCTRSRCGTAPVSTRSLGSNDTNKRRRARRNSATPTQASRPSYRPRSSKP